MCGLHCMQVLYTTRPDGYGYIMQFLGRETDPAQTAGLTILRLVKTPARRGVDQLRFEDEITDGEVSSL